MNEFLFTSPGEECSLLLGQKIGELLQAGDILALWGELAAGKTLLTRGIAHGLGVPPQTRVTSPTFTFINEYSGRLPLFHLDLYRISGAEDLETLPWQEALFGNGVAVIEWPGRLGRFLPETRWDIEFSICGQQARTMLIRRQGPDSRERMRMWLEALGVLQLDTQCRA